MFVCDIAYQTFLQMEGVLVLRMTSERVRPSPVFAESNLAQISQQYCCRVTRKR
jgi:hypothetical protein